MPAIIQTTTTNLQASIDFYTRLNFKLLNESAPTLLSDSKVLIEINPDRFARAGIKLYQESWKAITEKLTPHFTLIDIDNGYLLSDPSGCWVYLIEGQMSVDVPPAENAFGVLGTCAGLSLETTEMARSCMLWETLGFNKTMGGVEQGWIAYENGDGGAVSIMKPMACPHAFYNPSLSYFNGKNNLAIIENIRTLNIPITEEITHFNKEGIVDNIIIRDPGGLGFFIFSD